MMVIWHVMMLMHDTHTEQSQPQHGGSQEALTACVRLRPQKWITARCELLLLVVLVVFRCVDAIAVDVVAVGPRGRLIPQESRKRLCRGMRWRNLREEESHTLHVVRRRRRPSRGPHRQAQERKWGSRYRPLPSSTRSNFGVDKARIKGVSGRSVRCGHVRWENVCE